MCIIFLCVNRFLSVVSFIRCKQAPLKLENNIQKLSNIIQVNQFQEANVVSDKLPFNSFPCEKMVKKIVYEILLVPNILGEDIMATKERLCKSQAVTKSNMLPSDENSVVII